MHETMIEGVVAEDMPVLAAGFDRLVTIAPDPGWNGAGKSRWDAIAKVGEAAAKAHDTAGLTAACKACHNAFMAQYRVRFRPKSIL
jgi:hypothetical protein